MVRKECEYRCYIDNAPHVPLAFRRGFLWCGFSVSTFALAVLNILASGAETNLMVSSLRAYLGR